MKTSAILFGLALAAMSPVLSAAPPRDEAKATRFLYCGAWNAWWAYAPKDGQSDSRDVEARKSAGDSFSVAAVLLSDGQFFSAHKAEAMQKVDSVMGGKDRGRVTSEEAACDRTMHDEVVPLLKAENLIPDGAFDTTVSMGHMADVKHDIVEWHAMRHPDCKFQKVTDAQVVKRDKDAATEHWTILACDGRKFTYQVLVMHQQGGISDAVGDIDSSADGSHKP